MSAVKTEHASYVKKGNKIIALGSSRLAVEHFLEEEIPGFRQTKGEMKSYFDPVKQQYHLTMVMI